MPIWPKTFTNRNKRMFPRKGPCHERLFGLKLNSDLKGNSYLRSIWQNDQLPVRPLQVPNSSWYPILLQEPDKAKHGILQELHSLHIRYSLKVSLRPCSRWRIIFHPTLPFPHRRDVVSHSLLYRDSHWKRSELHSLVTPVLTFMAKTGLATPIEPPSFPSDSAGEM